MFDAQRIAASLSASGALMPAYTYLWFFSAALLLDFFDISLPRGDATGVTGALCAATLVILGPSAAFAIGTVSALLAHVLRRGFHAPRRIATVVGARTFAVAISAALFLYFKAGGAPWYPWAAVALVPAVFLVADLAASQVAGSLGTSRPFVRLFRGNLNGQAPLLVAGWSAALLLVITYGYMGAWSLIPVVALLLLMRQSYALLLDIRETYRTTVEVLVEAAEGQDSRRLGHAERTSAIARAIGMHLGLSAPQVERISYAALLHDIDAISANPETQASPDTALDWATGRTSAVFEGVEFFADILPILRLCDGEPPRSVSPEDMTAALVVALASDVDAADHAEVASAHHANSIDRVAPYANAAVKAKVVGSALALGFRTPAVS